MKSVGIRELKNNLSRVIRRVEGGESIDVTDRERVVARLAPPDAGAEGRRDRYEMLVAAGVIRAPAEGGSPIADWPRRRRLRVARGLAATLIDEDRGA